ncbi:IS3 family transposase [Corynebacterium macginleyi]|uniref:IS3 family transposase n=1 Tax=Corynebacterium macginleyi TaxID=38290 RepID=UPI00190C98B5|nr:IS3 family transposase [Corynebacterium macginleyi]MBK4164245.1 IS3 family transposase [Corynebacterium macginleyi]
MIGHLFMMMLIARFTRFEKDSDEVYGAPRITAELAERYQITLNRKTVAQRMRLVGIEGCHRVPLCQ